MDNFKNTLNRLADIKEKKQYLPEDMDLIFTCMEAEEDFIRAAAVLSVEGALYNPEVIDQLIYHFETEPNDNVKKSLIIQLGNFISAGYLEGFDDEGSVDTLAEDSDDFNEVIEQQIEERYVQAKNLFFQYLLENDEYDPFYFNILNSLSLFGNHPEIKLKVEELWDNDDETRCKTLLPIIENFPLEYEKQIIDILTESSLDEIIIKTLSFVSKIPSARIAELTAGYLQNANPELVSKALIALAEINVTPDLKNILQKFCLHEDSKIKNSAKRALDIYTAKNFSEFMEDYYK